ncbi:M14-type cytosolic carboxypeptidase [Bacteroidota bacterium]
MNNLTKTGILKTLSVFFTIISLILLLSVQLCDAQVAGKSKKKSTKKTKKIEKPVKKTNEIRTNVLNPDDDSMSGTLEWRVVLKDDNGNIELPERFRTWWYVRLDGVNKNGVTTLEIEGDGFPGKSVVLPVYSYDRSNWHRLNPKDIVSTSFDDGLHTYTIQKQFDSSSTVWLARYYPYSLSRLDKFIKTVGKSSFVKFEKIGSSSTGKPIYMLTITDPKVDDKTKKRIWIHSRTHPSETGGSYVIEGIVNYLISQCNENCKCADLSKLIFNIVPVVNPDGVALGNARVTPDSSFDLERMWLRDKDNYKLKQSCPPEVKAIHSAITNLDKKGPEFIIALNLHSKNAPQNWESFLYTNFKKDNKDFAEEGHSLFKKQLNYAKILSGYYCGDTINVRMSEESGKGIAMKHFPEMWWWLNFKDKVMAVTLETTSGYDGCFEEWVTYKDHEYLGEAIAKACNQYYKYYVSKEYERYEKPCEDIDELMEFYIGSGK